MLDKYVFEEPSFRDQTLEECGYKPCSPVFSHRSVQQLDTNAAKMRE